MSIISKYLDFVFYCMFMFKTKVLLSGPFHIIIFYVFYGYKFFLVFVISFFWYIIPILLAYIIIIFNNFFYFVATQYFFFYYAIEVINICWLSSIWLPFVFFKFIFVILNFFIVLSLFLWFFPYSLSGFVLMYFLNYCFEIYTVAYGTFYWEYTDTPVEQDVPPELIYEVYERTGLDYMNGRTTSFMIMGRFSPVRLHGLGLYFYDQFWQLPRYFILIASFVFVSILFIFFIMFFFYAIISLYILKFLFVKILAFFIFYFYYFFAFMLPFIVLNFWNFFYIFFFVCLVFEIFKYNFYKIEIFITDTIIFRRLSARVAIFFMNISFSFEQFKLIVQEHMEWVGALTMEGSEYVFGDEPFQPAHRTEDWLYSKKFSVYFIGFFCTIFYF